MLTKGMFFSEILTRTMGMFRGWMYRLNTPIQETQVSGMKNRNERREEGDHCATWARLLLCGLVLLSVCLCACSVGSAVDTGGMYLVTYEANGGRIDGMPGRELYVNPGDLLVLPAAGETSTSSMGRIIRRGYTLMGWYTKETVSFKQSPDGEYVALDAVYRRDNDGDAVLVYQAAEDGEYVLITGDAGDSYELYNPETEAHQALERYTRVFVAYDEGEHEGLLRYTRDETTPYAILGDLFEESYRGAYALDGETYRLAAEADPGPRYALQPSFVSAAEDVTALDRYDAIFTYDEADKWDFARDRMPEQDMTLYANWQESLTVTYVYWDGSSFSIYDNLAGETITKPTGSAKDGNGRTFVGWSRSQTEYDEWDFTADVYPQGTSLLTLYAFYKEGELIRITNASQLKQVGKDPSASYVLANDIDLEGVTGHPLGFTKDTVFTGSFDGGGHTLKNFTLQANGKLMTKLSMGLFSNAKGANIHDLNVDYSISVGKRNGANLVLGGIVGTDMGDNTTLTNCTGRVKIFTQDGSVCNGNISYGSLVGSATGSFEAVDCAVRANASGLFTRGEITVYEPQA